ncbi:MAG: MBL fold metallo-hydrolase [Acidimicrobiales bacterium]
MSDVQVIWSDAAASVHRLVVGPLANNVYVVRCRRSATAVLIDAADEAPRVTSAAAELGVRSVLTTHGHADHVGAAAALRAGGVSVWAHPDDAYLFDEFDRPLVDESVHVVGDLRLRVLHTPGHTPGSTCFALEGTPVLFTGDTLFPGGPGNARGEGGDFATLVHSLEQRIWRAFDDATLIWPGHGAPTLLARERPHLEEWVERGW